MSTSKRFGFRGLRRGPKPQPRFFGASSYGRRGYGQRAWQRPSQPTELTNEQRLRRAQFFVTKAIDYVSKVDFKWAVEQGKASMDSLMEILQQLTSVESKLKSMVGTAQQQPQQQQQQEAQQPQEQAQPSPTNKNAKKRAQQ